MDILRGTSFTHLLVIVDIVGSLYKISNQLIVILGKL